MTVKVVEDKCMKVFHLHAKMCLSLFGETSVFENQLLKIGPNGICFCSIVMFSYVRHLLHTRSVLLSCVIDNNRSVIFVCRVECHHFSQKI